MERVPLLQPSLAGAVSGGYLRRAPSPSGQKNPLDDAGRPFAAAWRVLIETLASDEELADAVVDREWRELGAEAGLSRDEVGVLALTNCSYLFELLITGRTPPSDHDVSLWREIGRTRAREGVRLESLIDAVMGSAEIIQGRAGRMLEGDPQREGLLCRLLDLMLAWTRVALRSVADGYRHVEKQAVEEEEQRRTSFVRGVLLGGNSRSAFIAGIEAYRLDPDWAYHGLRARGDDALALRDVERWLRTGNADGRGSMAVLIDGDICAFTSVLPDCSGIGIPIGTCEPATLRELHGAFPAASRALGTAEAMGLRGCHPLSSLMLYPAVAADGDVGETMVERYIAPVTRIGRSATSLVETVECYLRLDCRLDATAQEMCVHVNTVRYRLSRFEELTGSSLRSTEVLVGVWWALQRERMVRLRAAAGND